MGGRRERGMRGKVTDENSMDRIVTKGIIPAIEAVLEEENKTVDGKVCAIRNIINAYDIRMCKSS
jgi:hypothetical protein